MKNGCWFGPAMMTLVVSLGIPAILVAAHSGTQYTVYEVVQGSTLPAQTRVVIVPIDSGQEQYSLAVQFEDSGEASELIFDVGICEAPSAEMDTVACGGGYDQRWSELGSVIEELQGYALVQAQFSAIIEQPYYSRQVSTLPAHLGQIGGRQMDMMVDMVRYLELSFALNQDQTTAHLIKAERRIPYMVHSL